MRKRVRLKIVKPKTRGECENIPRPCPFVSCRYHLYFDMSSKNKLEVSDMEYSCALDVADEGIKSLDEIGAILKITRERARQIALCAQDAFRKAILVTEDAYEEPEHQDYDIYEYIEDE